MGADPSGSDAIQTLRKGIIMDKFERREPGVRQLSLALDPEMDFERLVGVLKDTLTFDFPRGCAPCLSGLDRVTIDSVIFEQMQQRF